MLFRHRYFSNFDFLLVIKYIISVSSFPDANLALFLYFFIDIFIINTFLKFNKYITRI